MIKNLSKIALATLCYTSSIQGFSVSEITDIHLETGSQSQVTHSSSFRWGFISEASGVEVEGTTSYGYSYNYYETDFDQDTDGYGGYDEYSGGGDGGGASDSGAQSSIDEQEQCELDALAEKNSRMNTLDAQAGALTVICAGLTYAGVLPGAICASAGVYAYNVDSRRINLDFETNKAKCSG
jgi:hypothetical protein